MPAGLVGSTVYLYETLADGSVVSAGYAAGSLTVDAANTDRLLSAPVTDQAAYTLSINVSGATVNTPFALVRKDCPVSWSTLNAQVQAALGNPNIDILKSIQAKVPAKFRGAVARDPTFDCYDPLVAPPPSSSLGIVTSETQPFPFYGTVEVSWKKG